MIIKFIKSPTARANLAYHIGEVGTVPDALAKDLIAEGYAVEVQGEQKKASKPAEKAPATRTRKKRSSK